MGIVMIGLLRATETGLRFLGNTAYHLGITLINIYDLVIFIPLRLEEWRLHHRQSRRHEPRQTRKSVETAGSNYTAEQTTVPFEEGHRV